MGGVMPQMQDLLQLIQSGDPHVMAGLSELLQLEEQGDPGEQSPLVAALGGGAPPPVPGMDRLPGPGMPAFSGR